MKKLFTLGLILLAGVNLTYSQNKRDRDEFRDAVRAARQEARDAKSESMNAAAAAPANPFNDMDSFGKNAKFLGSLYAGTLYVYKSCDPAVLLADLGLTLAADDHCAVHNFPTSNMPTTEVFDNVWQITIPKNTVDNVIYPMLNNGVGYDAFSGLAGSAGIIYTPRITIESVALNDPAAINPNTGLPMNGTFTTSLAGNRFRNFSIASGDFVSDQDNYASVAGRGLSRAYFRALGLPENVINQLFKKEMTLKFGIRARVLGPIDYAQFFYTFRLLGN